MTLLNEIIHDKEFHLSARRSVISLLEKPNKDPLYIKNWRPLSLLNTDNKLFGKILATRQQKAMNYIIHESQTGFMKNRHLAENILKIQEIMQHTKTKIYLLCLLVMISKRHLTNLMGYCL